MSEPRAIRPSKARDYPPLLFAGLVMLLMLAILPSALNLPQTNPSQTLEYAPVPPEDESSVDPPAGNFSSLGLGGGRGLGNNAAGDSSGGSALGGAVGGRALKAASTKRCVGNPPRQTEDPLSPPCVASFRGDNGGATYRGVTREEITIVLYNNGQCGTPPGYRVPGAGIGSSRASERPPCGEYHDLSQPPPPDDDEWPRTRVLRMYQRYFNERYQTYGRFVRFIVHYSSGYSPEIFRAEATEDIRRYNPFAVVNFIGGAEAYLETMTSKGIVHFLGSGSQAVGGAQEAYFEKGRGLVWGFEPTVETRAKAMVDWVCKQVVPFPTSFSGNPEMNDRPRKLGLLRYGGDGYPALIAYARLVKKGVEDCGGKFALERTHDVYCGSGPPCDPQQTHEVENMSEFRSEGITTIIWPGGTDSQQGKAAAKISYYPEVVVGGDGYNDLTFEGQWQDQTFWRQAMGITALPLRNPLTNAPCYGAAKEADPNAPTTDIRNFGCKDYDSVRQLFAGIQVAGPKLTPASMEKGFRAIPAVRSADARVPACFYPTGQYACGQDFSIFWYDPAGDDPESSNPGCNRALEGGLRRLPGGFPREDAPTRRNPANDPCNPTGFLL